ncbi:hypothetical protein R80B4_02271 [Fibrobacteres bacterium R8-0-B4]
MLEVTEEERQRAIMMSRRKFETDMTSKMLGAARRGREEGMEAERRKNIRLMHQLGLTIEVIAKVFELPEQDIKNILDSKEPLKA